MNRRDPDLALQFRRVIDKDGTFRRAQTMAARDRDSYLRGHWQVFERVHGRKAVRA